MSTAAPSALQAGGNMEGKEVRFGIANSAIWAMATTDASNGSVNSMHDSYTPLGGLVPMVNIQLGEIIFGGVGSGLYGMLLFAMMAVFVAGLMVGRTPEYLGKKIEAKEVKMAMLAILILPLSILGFTALARCCRMGFAGLANAGPHGFSEILYAYTSGTGNNGSAFAGISANTPFYNTTIGVRDADRPLPDDRADDGGGGIAGRQEDRAAIGGTFPTDRRALFVGLLVGVILIMGGLTYFPALSLGPIVEHFAMLRRQALSEVEHMDASNKPSHRQNPQAHASATMTDTQNPDPGDRRRVPQARSAHMMARNPVMFVVEIVATLTTILFIRDLVDRRGRSRLLVPDQSVALVHGAVRQFRRSRRRGPRQGAGRDPCARPRRN